MGKTFKTGSEVECKYLDNENITSHNAAGIWFETRVVRKKGQDYLLEFEGGRQLYIPSNNVMPPQPKDKQKINPGDIVDVYIKGGGWQQCRAVSCKESQIEAMFLFNANSGKKEVDSSIIRLHREYDGEGWVPKIEGWKQSLPDFSLEYPYPCLACPPNSKWFKNSKQVKDHYKQNHKSSNLTCKRKCGNGFATNALLAAHFEQYNHK